jgi:hypothetical protein
MTTAARVAAGLHDAARDMTWLAEHREAPALPPAQNGTDRAAAGSAERHLADLQAELLRVGVRAELTEAGGYPQLHARLWEDDRPAVAITFAEDAAGRAFWHAAQRIGSPDDLAASCQAIVVLLRSQLRPAADRWQTDGASFETCAALSRELAGRYDVRLDSLNPRGLRYVAIARSPGISPHTVITSDPAELLRELSRNTDSGYLPGKLGSGDLPGGPPQLGADQ